MKKKKSAKSKQCHNIFSVLFAKNETVVSMLRRHGESIDINSEWSELLLCSFNSVKTMLQLEMFASIRDSGLCSKEKFPPIADVVHESYCYLD